MVIGKPCYPCKACGHPRGRHMNDKCCLSCECKRYVKETKKERKARYVEFLKLSIEKANQRIYYDTKKIKELEKELKMNK